MQPIFSLPPWLEDPWNQGPEMGMDPMAQHQQFVPPAPPQPPMMQPQEDPQQQQKKKQQQGSKGKRGNGK